PELVALALDEESRRRAGLQEREVRHHRHRQAESEERAHALFGAAHPQGHRSAEGKAAEDEGESREAALHLRERGADVVLLAAALVVRAFAAPDAPEVEAQDGYAVP